jgi:hypothetical protein
MTKALGNSATVIWLVLVLATALSWWFGTHNAEAAGAHRTATLSVMLLAFVKVHIVITHFMEVRTAPLWLKLVCESWVVIVCGIIIVLYLIGAAAP